MYKQTRRQRLKSAPRLSLKSAEFLKYVQGIFTKIRSIKLKIAIVVFRAKEMLEKN